MNALVNAAALQRLPLDNDPRLERLLDELYLGVSDHGGFNPFLALLQQQFRCQTATLSIRETRKSQVIGGWYQDMPEADVQWYISHLAWRDPLFHLANRQSGFCSAFINHQQTLQDPLISQWCAQAGLVDGACAIAYRDDQYCVALTLGRGAQHGHFSASELQQLDQLLPHLRRAISLQQLAHQRQQTPAYLAEALHAMTVPLLVMSPGLQLQFANQAARQWLQSSPLVNASEPSSTNLTLQFSDHRHNANLYAELHKLQRKPSQPATSLAFRDAAQPLTLTLTSLINPVAENRPTLSTPGVLISVHDWQQHDMPQPRHISELFGLSQTEGLICSYLCRGDSADMIASTLNREISTVRSHIKSMLRKTDTRRQTELVARVLSTTLKHSLYL
ncbi:helix-turn-helix transcriptional regulator [Thalassolituus pacificus]|uniref:Helix-turn-helix transcriptional regulator n=1 Tax=Thalassolituus pacificus TaxID=2975440 RepID=A0A9X2WJN0_9GAMM|nr:helix-turn-helix transcriptional regulator [Thalassolituus pacificus]MCT7361107.1 helix-turn-helix transcriptional regulator [Thalassolituus pacificus]